MAYRQAMAQFAGQGYLDIWYDYVDLDDIAARGPWIRPSSTSGWSASSARPSRRPACRPWRS